VSSSAEDARGSRNRQASWPTSIDATASRPTARAGPRLGPGRGSGGTAAMAAIASRARIALGVAPHARISSRVAPDTHYRSTSWVGGRILARHAPDGTSCWSPAPFLAPRARIRLVWSRSWSRPARRVHQVQGPTGRRVVCTRCKARPAGASPDRPPRRCHVGHTRCPHEAFKARPAVWHRAADGRQRRCVGPPGRFPASADFRLPPIPGCRRFPASAATEGLYRVVGRRSSGRPEPADRPHEGRRYR
jgi:hypothetical protein